MSEIKRCFFWSFRYRIRRENAVANLWPLRRSALNMLTYEKTQKLGMNNKRLSANWDDEYLFKVLAWS